MSTTPPNDAQLCIDEGRHLATQRHTPTVCPVNQENPAADLSEDGQAMYLVSQLVGASMDANYRTMDSLYEQEKQRRMALEVLIDIVLERSELIWGGTTRQYENCLDILRFKGKSAPDNDPGFNGSNWIEVLSKQHPEMEQS